MEAFDGVDRPLRAEGVKAPPEYSEEYRQVDEFTRSVVQKKSGMEISRFTLTISADGRTMTQVRAGNPRETLVFDRQ